MQMSGTIVAQSPRKVLIPTLQMDESLDFTTLKQRFEVADGARGLLQGKLKEIGYSH